MNNSHRKRQKMHEQWYECMRRDNTYVSYGESDWAKTTSQLCIQFNPLKLNCLMRQLQTWTETPAQRCFGLRACSELPFHKLCPPIYIGGRIILLVGICKYAEIVKLALLSPIVAASAGRRNIWSMSSRKPANIRTVFPFDHVGERHSRHLFPAV